MRSYINIGSSPSEEDCAQVGRDDYHERARAECKRYMELIRVCFGEEPEGARLAVKSFPHDFGSYYEVVCWFDDDIQESVDYAYAVENNSPATWDDTEKRQVAK